jgi:hypothetical protein
MIRERRPGWPPVTCPPPRFPTSAERTALEAEFARPDRSRRQVIEDILWALVNSAEFVYED